MYKLLAIIVGVGVAVQIARWTRSRLVRRRTRSAAADALDQLVEQMRRQATTGDFGTRVAVDQVATATRPWRAGELRELAEQYNRVLDAVGRRLRDLERSGRNAEYLLKENRELRDRVAELAHTNLQAVGREQRLIELQNEVNELARRLGETDRYDLPVEQPGGRIRLRA